MSVDAQLNMLLSHARSNSGLVDALDGIAAELRRMVAAIERVKDLHAPVCDGDGFYKCGECKKVPDHYGNILPADWPCSTLKTLNGEWVDASI